MEIQQNNPKSIVNERFLQKVSIDQKVKKTGKTKIPREKSQLNIEALQGNKTEENHLRSLTSFLRSVTGMKSATGSEKTATRSETPRETDPQAKIKKNRDIRDTSDNYAGISVTDYINQAKKSVHMRAFSLSDRKVIESLINAQKRGVKVKVLLDPFMFGTFFDANSKTMEHLKEAGIEAKWYPARGKPKMPIKLAAFDKKSLLIGPAGLSFKKLHINREIVTAVDDKSAVLTFEKQFTKDWNNSTIKANGWVGLPDWF